MRRRKRRETSVALLLTIALALLALVLLTLAVRKKDAAEKYKMLRLSAVQVKEETGQQTTEESEEAEQGIYGCRMYNVYGFPWNTMTQDWDGEQIKGFYYHEISEECRKEGGEFPVIAQVYTYIICKEYGVDYEMVFALIEQESKCKWDTKGDGGSSIGLMQVSRKWHSDRMEKLNCNDLTNPFQNVRVGVDFLHELQGKLEGSDFLQADVLAAYNYGLSGARKHLWNKGIHWYSYNKEIMERAQELKEETAAAQARRNKEKGIEE